MFKEFREFAARGNVIDLAVGVIIGAAFGKIITSVVDDLVMPPIGMALSRVDFKQLFVSLNGVDYPTLEAAKAASAPVIAYGNFVNTIIAVPDCRVRHLPHGAADQQAQSAAADRRCPRLSVVPVANPAEGDALRALHRRGAGRVI